MEPHDLKLLHMVEYLYRKEQARTLRAWVFGLIVFCAAGTAALWYQYTHGWR